MFPSIDPTEYIIRKLRQTPRHIDWVQKPVEPPTPVDTEIPKTKNKNPKDS